MTIPSSNLPTRVPCPACGGQVKIPPGQGGRRFRCPRCDAEITAPPVSVLAEPAPPSSSESDDILFDLPPTPYAKPPTTPTPVPAAAMPPAPPVPSGASLSPAEISDRGATGDPPVSASPVPSAKASIPAKPPTPSKPSPADDEEFGVVCPLCGTFQYVRRSQIGKSVRCVDCHTPVPVRPPQPRHSPPAAKTR